MASSKFDSKKFDKAVRNAANEAVQARADDLQKLVGRLSSTHKGRPVNEVKTALQSGWRQVTRDGSITDPELTTWATAISPGNS